MTATRAFYGSTRSVPSAHRTATAHGVAPTSPSSFIGSPNPASRSGARSAFALVALIGIAAAVAAFGAIISGPAIDGWYAETPKPMWNPPNAVFGPVWTVLYVLMSVAAWLVWRRPDSELRTRALRLYIVQLALNALWSPAFFGLGALVGAPGLWVALGIIVALNVAILATMIRFADVSRVAAGLLVPYWFWALFATTLNAAIAVLAR